MDCGVMGNFDTIIDEARYCGMIKRILKIDFRTFRTYIFECRWFDGVSRRHESGIYMVDSTKTYKGKYDNFVLPKNCEQVCWMSFFVYVRMYVPRSTNVSFLPCLQVIYLPSIYDQKYWFVIEVTPRGRCIFDKVEVEILEDPSIPHSTDADDGGMEIDETDPSLFLDEEELDNGEEDKIDSLDEASEDGGALGLFVDLGAMGLELDDDACRDLMEDEMQFYIMVFDT